MCLEKPVWKRMMPNTRELCDQCCTAIFNGHMLCGQCGFAVCLDCFRERKAREASSAAANASFSTTDSSASKLPFIETVTIQKLILLMRLIFKESGRGKEKDEFGWLCCLTVDPGSGRVKRVSHQPDELLYAHLILPNSKLD